MPQHCKLTPQAHAAATAAVSDLDANIAVIAKGLRGASASAQAIDANKQLPELPGLPGLPAALTASMAASVCLAAASTAVAMKLL